MLLDAPVMTTTEPTKRSPIGRCAERHRPELPHRRHRISRRQDESLVTAAEGDGSSKPSGVERCVAVRKGRREVRLPPGPPWTPPPGWADAEARYSRCTGVSVGQGSGWPKQQLLIQRGGTAVDRSVDQAPFTRSMASTACPQTTSPPGRAADESLQPA
jgi:hypothetical protein